MAITATGFVYDQFLLSPIGTKTAPVIPVTYKQAALDDTVTGIIIYTFTND